MKILLAVLVSLATINVAADGQSRRVQPTDQSQKTNRRPDPAPTPTPAASPSSTPEPLAPTPKVSVPAVDEGEVIKIDTEIVTVPVRAVDKNNRFVTGLTKDDFKVFDEGVPQEIAMFSSESAPFTVALVLDMSFSAKFMAEDIHASALSFIEQLRPADKVMVVSFDEQIHLLCEPTSDRAEIGRAIRSARINYGTSVYDAMQTVMERMGKIGGRKAIVLFSDGVDTSSKLANDYSNIGDAMELDAMIYPIRYDTYNEVQAMKNGGVVIGGRSTPGGLPPMVGTMSSRGTTREEYDRADRYLDGLSLRTGGRLYQATTIGSLSSAFAKIASELREYYSIGFYPSKEKARGKQYKIKVKTDRPGISVKAKDSYSTRK